MASKSIFFDNKLLTHNNLKIILNQDLTHRPPPIYLPPKIIIYTL